VEDKSEVDKRAPRELSPTAPLLARSGQPMSRFVPLGSRFVARSLGEGGELATDLASVLDRRQSAGSQLPLARAPRKTPPTTPAAKPAPQVPPAEENDAAWYAKMRRYLAAQHGETIGPGVVAPEQTRPAPIESDEAWYAKMARHLAAQRAESANSQEAPPATSTASAGPVSPTEPSRSVDVPRLRGQSTVHDLDRPVTSTNSPLGRQLTIGKHIRDYVTTGESPLSPRDQARLDTISMQALAICERELGPLLSRAAQRVLPNLQVSVSLDLSRLSDDEAAESWGRRLAEVVRYRLRRGIAEIGGTSGPE
jgi:hypothetical protein